jgi:hypothetical protein
MARFKVNIFYVFSAICSLALVGYAWLIFLPSFQGAAEYSSVRYVVIIVTVLLLIVSCIQAILSVKVEKAQSVNSAERTK